MSSRKLILPPTKFKQSDIVKDFNGQEGIITEVYVSYSTTAGLAIWDKPLIHYKVRLYPMEPEKIVIYVEGELTDARQLTIPFDQTDDDDVDTPRTHDWLYKPHKNYPFHGENV